MDANKIIDACGGTGKVAEVCEVTTGAVSQWRRTGIPRARLMFLRLKFPGAFVGEVAPGRVDSCQLPAA